MTETEATNELTAVRPELEALGFDWATILANLPLLMAVIPEVIALGQAAKALIAKIRAILNPPAPSPTPTPTPGPGPVA